MRGRLDVVVRERQGQMAILVEEGMILGIHSYSLYIIVEYE
jgi:hypothetical protein